MENTNKAVCAFAIMAFCAMIVLPSFTFGKTSLGAISDIVGDVLVKRDGDSTWIKAKPRMPVYEKDAVATKEESRCELLLTGDRVVRIAEKSVTVIATSDAAGVKVNAAKGSVWVNVKHLVNNTQRFEVGTPTAVAAIRGTVFAVDCNTNAAKYSVFKGVIAVSSGAQKGGDSAFIVKQGSQIALVKDLNLFMKDEEKAIKDYMEQSNAEMEKFQQQQQNEFDEYQKEMERKIQEMVSEERKAFTEKNGINYAVRPIDTAMVGKSEWAQWNQKRDATLGW